MFQSKGLLRLVILFLVLILAGVSLLVWNIFPPRRVTPAGPGAGIADNAITVYYFHGTMRCPTCQKIELVARETVELHFADELATGAMRWLSVNFELDENQHFIRDFKLRMPSLALECGSGEDVRHVILHDTWNKVEIQEDLEDYVINSIERFRDGFILSGSEAE